MARITPPVLSRVTPPVVESDLYYPDLSKAPDLCAAPQRDADAPLSGQVIPFKPASTRKADDDDRGDCIACPDEPEKTQRPHARHSTEPKQAAESDPQPQSRTDAHQRPSSNPPPAKLTPD